MKHLHVHVAVDDLETAIGFYSTLFAATPSVVKADYAHPVERGNVPRPRSVITG